MTNSIFEQGGIIETSYQQLQTLSDKIDYINQLLIEKINYNDNTKLTNTSSN
jgi:hypothetical protein